MEKMCDILKGIKIKGLREIQETSELENVWEEIAGVNIYNNVKLLYIEKKILFLKTKNPSWSYQISMMKSQIINKIRETGIDVDDIRLKSE